MNTATMEPRAAQFESDRELKHRLRAEKARTERECAEARRALNAARAVVIELARSGKLIAPENAPTRSLRAPGLPRGRRLEPEELLVAKAEAEAEALKATKKLLVKTAALRRATVALESYNLEHGLLDRHEAACERVRAANERAEAAHIELIAALISREEACAQEAAAARPIVKAAASVLTSDEERSSLRHRAVDEVPVQLSEDGGVLAWRARPTAGLFGLHGVDWQAGNDNYFEAIADVVRGGRGRVHGNCGSERVADRIVKALGERNN